MQLCTVGDMRGVPQTLVDGTASLPTRPRVGRCREAAEGHLANQKPTPMTLLKGKANQIHRTTPPDRNRYADFLRALAIVMVVLGHWVVAYIVVYDDGFVRPRTVLAVEPATQWLTWVFQVMPLFFFVGGLVNAISWNRAKDRGLGWVDWIRRRARRLLYPLVALILFWMAMVALQLVPGVSDHLVRTATFHAFLPVWFIAAYLFIVAIAPVGWWLHRRLGAGVIVGLLLSALAVDLLFNAGIRWVMWANFVLVWTAVHQLGFFWYDRRMPMKLLPGVALAAVGLAVALWLVFVADYPLSMVATGEPEFTNDYPPSMALVGLAIAQIGVVAAAHDVMQRWLHRPWPWTAVTLVGNRLMTVFLWHMSAMILVGLLVYPTGLWPARDDIDLIWWLLRIPWVVLLAAALAVLVALFGRFEQPKPAEPIKSAGWIWNLRAAAGVCLAALGLTLIVTNGIYAGGGLEGFAWMPLVMVAAGFLALDVVKVRLFELRP